LARLPILYALILVAEVAGLSWLYMTDPPASTDPISVNLGWLGLGSMIALLIYSVARRSRALRRVARLSYWLHFHIFLACQGVIGVLFHSWHVLDKSTLNFLNPAVLSGIATFIIFGSGLFGRYLYALVPRTIGGVQMKAAEVDAELQETPDLPDEARRLIASDAGPGALKGLGLPKDQLELATHRLKLKRRRATLEKVEPIFRLWIVLHRPLAAILYVISIVHVIFSFMFSSALAS